MSYVVEQFHLLNQIDKTVKDDLLGYGSFIAGGALASIFSNQPINDFDIFYETESARDQAISIAKEKFASPKVVATDCAFSFIVDRQRYQLIRFVGEVHDTLKSFDFTICRAAYVPWYPEGSRFVLFPDFLQHLAQRKLIFNIAAEFPICSLYRAAKYIKRGFHFPGIEAIKLGLRIQSLKIETVGDLRKQLMGIDTLFLKDLTDALKNQEHKTFELNEFLQLLDDELTKKLSIAAEE